MHTKRRRLLLILAALVLVVLAVLVGVFAGAKYFVGQESAVRTAWRVDVGELLGEDQELGLELRHADVESDLTVLQLVPFEVDQEGFTYYDTAVQDRLAQALEKAKAGGQAWEAGAPLAVLNPYGTGNNGLYLYFETDLETQVTYTVHVEGLPDFTATAADQSGQAYSRTHEFQLIGLVPGETNQVTMVISGSWGNVRQQVSFSITMPETRSGYPTRLDYTDGESGAALSQGLFTMMRTNGYLGYGFFFDNEGVLRYEMVLEGYGLDRILWVDGDMVTCISSTRLARLDGLGRVKRVYDLTGYELHHDIIGGLAGKVIALVDKLDSETIEDVVVEVDLETGAVTELVDFSVLMEAYFRNETHPVPLTGDFFWQAGEWDWLHLNTVEYLEEGDSLIVSSRETSTVVKVENVHSQPELVWLLGDPAFWEGTAYEDLSLTPVGDFVFQYGQHSVEYAGAGEEEGVYYLRLYNNNYWSNSTRDYVPELDESVSESLYGDSGDHSWVYVYRVDENQGTFSLEQSFPVPYSSIVSNAAPAGEDGNWVVNSGISHVYGEYDETGTLIREFSYECTMQGYRTFKHSFAGFWFQA
ncbi:MAG TPA: aryl-sulfate sulfotransferase [Candidatus Intestinimonas pullistercoris]|uniref:Aryl-sulfate sulfotransferase n=1 Tax=Candidatus Intestinimonas pullistercoris TaxID=2838623 RepID=A0A9D2P1R7_9FIRM|nr:aryl-sulfate sulfotransferase [Candidatus Intestinimonas pullistercoris]